MSLNKKIMWTIYIALLILLPAGLTLFYWQMSQKNYAPTDSVLPELAPEKHTTEQTYAKFNTASLDPDWEPSHKWSEDITGKLCRTAENLLKSLYPADAAIIIPPDSVKIIKLYHAQVTAIVIIPNSPTRPERKFTLQIPITYTPHNHCEVQMPLLK